MGQAMDHFYGDDSIGFRLECSVTVMRTGKEEGDL